MSAEIQEYEKDLFKNIPISQDLGIKIDELDSQKVVLWAPLQANVNYEGVAFGGSLNTVAVLSCYLTLRHLLKSHGTIFKSLVIQSSEIRYLQPTPSDFYCSCRRPDAAALESFFAGLRKKDRARVVLNAEIRCRAQEQARVLFSGAFVVKNS